MRGLSDEMHQLRRRYRQRMAWGQRANLPGVLGILLLANVVGDVRRAIRAGGSILTIEELAQEVLNMLDVQRRYFGDRTRDNLIASKQLEDALKLKCKKIVYPDLFSKESD
jgi:hypothetical protein